MKFLFIFSVFSTTLLFSIPAVHGGVTLSDQELLQQDNTMLLIHKVGKKMQKVSEVSLICVDDALKGYGFPEECLRWNVALNTKLNELFNETKTDMDKILYN